MQKVKQLIKELNKKQIILLIIAILIVSSFVAIGTVQTVNQVRKNILAKHGLLEWEIQERERYTAKILIKVTSIEGIEQIEFPDGDILYCKGRQTVGIDYDIVADVGYDFKIKEVGKDEVTETVLWELPRIQGDYSLNNEIYVYKPDLTGYNSDYTRYLSYENENLVPGNWITDEEPANWYNYKESQWANIYVETGGPETYYVWIPRYCFKLDQEEQRSDVKFIDVYNNYTDENGNVTPWKSTGNIVGLEEQGYQVPDAFAFNGIELPGYWMMKYTAGDITTPSTINFDMVATREKMTIKNIKLNTSLTNANPITKYTIAMAGKIVKTITNADELADITSQVIDLAVSDNNEKTINVTGLNADGEIVGSMTKKYEPAAVNSPELNEFDQNTTFYVTWDGNGNEHSTIPISEPAPADWYEYSFGEWANIVTRNNGLETYYTWIPRYEFKLDQTNERSNIRFLKGIETEATQFYQIPEAFTFNRTRTNRILDDEIYSW